MRTPWADQLADVKLASVAFVLRISLTSTHDKIVSALSNYKSRWHEGFPPSGQEF